MAFLLPRGNCHRFVVDVVNADSAGVTARIASTYFLCLLLILLCFECLDLAFVVSSGIGGCC